MGRAPRRAVTIALLSLAMVVSACTVGPSERPPVAVRGENMPPAPSPSATAPPAVEELPTPDAGLATIAFFDCTEDALLTAPPVPADRALRVECGEISVPADPGQPGLGSISLGVQKVELDGAPPDLPPLLAVGDTGIDPSAGHAVALAAQVDPALLQHFSVIGLDRRGSGVDLLDCSPAEARAALVDATVTSEEALAVLLEDARTIVQECSNLNLDGALSSYRTALTATDVEELRADLGVSRLSAIGVGDGAAALAEWARIAPEAVGRLVLDGPPYPELDEPDLSESRAGAAEAAFEAFTVACRAAPGCPLGTDPRAAVGALVDRLRVQPLAAADGSRLTAGATLTVLLDELSTPERWPALATALAAATNGDPVPLLAAMAPVTGPGGRFDAMLATSCNDTRRRLSPGEIAELTASWQSAYPLFGTTLAMRLVACAPWPSSPAPPTVGRAEGAPPILVVGTAADPAGALEGSRRTAEGLASARFLSWQGAGTGAYPRTACVSAVIDAMLVDGVVPATGILCPP